MVFFPQETSSKSAAKNTNLAMIKSNSTIGNFLLEYSRIYLINLLQNKELKLEECQLNIKTFWNPELKKERMARMSDNEKYQQLKDSYQKLAEESDRSAMVIQQLSEELQHQRQGFMLATEGKEGKYA